MKNIVRAAMLLGVMYLASPGQAMAAGIDQFGFHPYMGLGLGAYNLQLKINSVPVSQNNTAFGGYLQLGSDFNDYLGAELRIGTTNKESSTHATGSLSQQEDYMFSYLLKLQYPTTPDLRIYALLGGTTAKDKVSGTAVSAAVASAASGTKTAFSFGAGVDYRIADQLRAGVEWVRYANDITVDSTTGTKLTIDGYTATLKYLF
jgi:opacity protein-like surface antigen